MLNDLAALLPTIIALSRQAGESILPFCGRSELLDIQHKADNLPFTAADLSSNNIILAGLLSATPDIPILSEEGDVLSFDLRKAWKRYWLIDPLDGTRGFIDNSDQFTVNIALIEHHQVVLGVVYVPVSQVCYYACQNNGAFMQKGDEQPTRLQTRTLDWDHLSLMMGHYHTTKKVDDILQQYPNTQLMRVNSSLKFGVLSEGRSDIYPRVGPTNEWDTAAGQCVLEEAGGVVVDLLGDPLRYNRQASLINPEFLAIGDPTQLEQCLTIFKNMRRDLND